MELVEAYRNPLVFIKNDVPKFFTYLSSEHSSFVFSSPEGNKTRPNVSITGNRLGVLLHFWRLPIVLDYASIGCSKSFLSFTLLVSLVSSMKLVLPILFFFQHGR